MSSRSTSSGSRRTAAAAAELRLHGCEEEAPRASRRTCRPPLVRAGRARARRAPLLPPTARLLRRALRRVAVRCPFGLPAVTEQSPYAADGEPFPTTYYLTCRHLVAAVSRLEAAGGVERWSAATRAEPALASSLAAGDDEQRLLRTELAGETI